MNESVSAPRTMVYIDGFNLYFRVTKLPDLKWLNPQALVVNALAPKFDVVHTHFFSAPVKHQPEDPQKVTRQRFYWRALRTLDSFTIHEGFYTRYTQDLQLVKPLFNADGEQVTTADVKRFEEKQSDVNLAIQAMIDACNNRFDCAAILTNDSDHERTLREIKETFDKTVLLICPNQHVNPRLKQHADHVYHLQAREFASAQFSERLKDEKGGFRKPKAWSSAEDLDP